MTHYSLPEKRRLLCPTLASTEYYNCDCECINDENQTEYVMNLK